MRTRRKIFSIIILSLLFLTINKLFGQVKIIKPVNVGFNAGFGLPRVPFAIYHPPLSITGGLNLNLSLGENFAVQFNGNALHTLNLGTVTGAKKDLKFELYWAGIDAMIKIRRTMFRQQFLSIGVGRYMLNQEIDIRKNNMTTTGVNLGVVQWSSHKRWSTSFDIRWHLLFEPSPRPQVLIVAIGWVF